MEGVKTLQPISYRYGILNGFVLKLIAIVTMLIDHIGFTVFPQESWMRYIGRLSFPIFCFLIVEGFFHTRDVKKYGIRLLMFALISEIPYDLAFYNRFFFLNIQNVFFTLLIGLIMIYMIEKESKVYIKVIYVIIFGLLADMLHTDYASNGVIQILIFYLFRKRNILKTVSTAVLNILMGKIQAIAAFACIPILLYNGKQGPKMKYLFYIFYPAHLLVLYGICIVLGR